MALAHDELDVAYQPIVRSTDGLVTAVEALLRWTHPQRGAVPALWMVGIAERSELINEVGAWVLQRSCRDHRQWVGRDSRSPLDLAVNVSARQLVDPNFLSTVRSVLARTDMDPTALILEVTENIYIEDGEPVMAVLAELRALGIRIALDDFGCGYSSLNYLGRLPIDILKIDRSFVADIGVVPTSTAIVEAVTNLAHVLELTVVAEGIETQDQRDAVYALGCDYSQGYFYGRPETADAIAAQLDQCFARPLHLPHPENSPALARVGQPVAHA